MINAKFQCLFLSASAKNKMLYTKYEIQNSKFGPSKFTIFVHVIDSMLLGQKCNAVKE